MHGSFLQFMGFRDPREFYDLPEELQAWWIAWYNARMR